MGMCDRIKALRLKNELTQEELANMLGLKKSAIAKYENGRVENIKRSVIQKMATIFNVTPSYLMGWIDEPESYKQDGSDIFWIRLYQLIEESGKTLDIVIQELNDQKALSLKFSDFENKKNATDIPLAHIVQEIADYFGVTLNYLVGLDDNRISQELTTDIAITLNNIIDLLDSENRVNFDNVAIDKDIKKLLKSNLVNVMNMAEMLIEKK